MRRRNSSAIKRKHVGRLMARPRQLGLIEEEAAWLQPVLDPFRLPHR